MLYFVSSRFQGVIPVQAGTPVLVECSGDRPVSPYLSDVAFALHGGEVEALLVI
jgi:hypothetical protein